MKYVNKGIRKKDAMSLLTGKPVYTDDIAPVSYTHLDVYKRQLQLQHNQLYPLYLLTYQLLFLQFQP